MDGQIGLVDKPCIIHLSTSYSIYSLPLFQLLFMLFGIKNIQMMFLSKMRKRTITNKASRVIFDEITS